MSALKDKAIIIIDDADDVCTLLQRILEGDGATVHKASNVEIGLELIAKHSPHLIITDLDLPGKTGFDLLAARKSSPHLAEIPTIVLSGAKDKNSIVKAISMGAADYMIKPFEAKLILQKTRKQLRKGVLKSRKFAPEEMPVAELSVKVDVREVTEAGCLLEGPLKLLPDAEVKIECQLLDDLDLKAPIVRAQHASSAAKLPNRYISELKFVGLGGDAMTSFRKKVRGST